MILLAWNIGMPKLAYDMSRNLAPKQPAGVFGGVVREGVEVGAGDIGSGITPPSDHVARSEIIQTSTLAFLFARYFLRRCARQSVSDV